MAWLGHRLARAGFSTRRFSYPTVTQDLRENAEDLARFVRTLDAATVHFVGHSLGGLVIRALFSYSPPRQPGRVVTLVTPHSGSYVATVLSRYHWGRAILGKSMAGLLRGELAGARMVREVGVIQGTLPVGLGRLLPGLPRPNDGVCSLADMHFPGATDTLTLRVAHTGMLLSSQAADQAGHFLRTGRFSR